jgi:hypothetical protein
MLEERKPFVNVQMVIGYGQGEPGNGYMRVL